MWRDESSEELGSSRGDVADHGGVGVEPPSRIVGPARPRRRGADVEPLPVFGDDPGIVTEHRRDDDVDHLIELGREVVRPARVDAPTGAPIGDRQQQERVADDPVVLDVEMRPLVVEIDPGWWSAADVVEIEAAGEVEALTGCPDRVRSPSGPPRADQ